MHLVSMQSIVKPLIQLVCIKVNLFFDLIHSDVWGLALTVSLFEFKYFVTFVDDYS